MPRRGFIPKREVLPDPVHGTTVVTKLINQIMLDGKRGTAQRICYTAFDTVAEKTGKSADRSVQRRSGQRRAPAGSQGPPRGRRHLSGAYRDPSRAPSDPGAALAGGIQPQAR